jgi:hypothetical protein
MKLEKDIERSRCRILRLVFIFLHFFGGFFGLWLVYHYSHLLLSGPFENDVIAEAFIETLYLVLGVVWGNAGWDKLGEIRDHPSSHHIATIIVWTTAPMSIVIPLLILAIEFWIDLSEHNIHWFNLHLLFLLLWIAVLTWIRLWARGLQRDELK